MKLNFKSPDNKQIVGDAIASVLPDHGKPWYRVRHLLILNLLMILPLLSGASSGYDGSLMNGLQSMTTWKAQFNSPTGTLLGLINAAMTIGGAAAIPLTGWMADRFGRKKTMVLGLIGVVVGAAIQASGTTIAQLIVSRLLLGAFNVMAAQPAPMILAELAYPTLRGKYTALYHTSYYLGSIAASWACYGCTKRSDTWSWRIPVILQAGYPVIQLCGFYLVPESPRWLVSKGRIDEAREFLVKHHAGGDTDSPLVETELIEIMDALEREKVAKQTSWKSLIATPGNRKRTYIAITLGISSQWAGNAVISYYLTLVLDTIGITSSTTQTLINGFLQIFNFVFAILGALAVDNLGRRLLFLWSSAGMLVSYVIWTACSAVFSQTGSVSAGKGVLAFIFIFFFHYDIAYTPLVTAYPTEIFPYSLRAKGCTVTFLLIYCSLLIASFCNSIAISKIGWKYYIVFCVILTLMVINNYLFYPETKGYSLEELAVLFDGEPAADLEAEVSQNDHLDLDDLLSSKKALVVEHVEAVR